MAALGEVDGNGEVAGACLGSATFTSCVGQPQVTVISRKELAVAKGQECR